MILFLDLDSCWFKPVVPWFCSDKTEGEYVEIRPDDLRSPQYLTMLGLFPPEVLKDDSHSEHAMFACPT